MIIIMKINTLAEHSLLRTNFSIFLLLLLFIIFDWLIIQSLQVLPDNVGRRPRQQRLRASALAASHLPPRYIPSFVEIERLAR